MNSRTTPDFWSAFEALPTAIQRQARSKFKLWQANPNHPSLHFKQLRPGLWSVRVSVQHRALAWRDGQVLLWFWIGSHAEYDRMIGS